MELDIKNNFGTLKMSSYQKEKEKEKELCVRPSVRLSIFVCRGRGEAWVFGIFLFLPV